MSTKTWFALMSVFAFGSFICGIQNEESNWWWLPCGVLAACAIYCLTKVAKAGSGKE